MEWIESSYEALSSSHAPLFKKKQLLCPDAIRLLGTIGKPLTSDILEDGGWFNKQGKMVCKTTGFLELT